MLEGYSRHWNGPGMALQVLGWLWNGTGRNGTAGIGNANPGTGMVLE